MNVRLRLLLLAIPILSVSQSWAGVHDKGNVQASLGGSFSRTSSFEASKAEEQDRDYKNTDSSLYLSFGIFVIDGLELGISGNGFTSEYQSQDDVSSQYDSYGADLFAKHYFDNSTPVTPYLGIAAGGAWLETEVSSEENTSFSGTAGIEFLIRGALSCYIEYSHQYRIKSGDTEGDEWRSMAYLGISYYWDFGWGGR